MKNLKVHLSVIAAVLGVSSSLLVAGCSAKADFEKICNAPQLSGAAAEVDPAKKAMKLAQWISQNVRSSEAKRTFAAIATVAPEHKGTILKQAAIEAGYTGPCPFAEQ